MKSTILEFTRGNDKRRTCWAVILAGGGGCCMQPWIQTTFGISAPNQYWRFFREQSLFQRTADRIHYIIPEGKIVAVILPYHENLIGGPVSTRGMRLLVQPADGKTTAAIFLAISHISAIDKRACVAIFPSDQYVHPESEFINSMRRAIEISPLMPNKIMLIGACPENHDPEYDWIIPGPHVARFGPNRLSFVAALRERPAGGEIKILADAGGLWNTNIMVGNADAFWKAGEECNPKMMECFTRYRSAIGTNKEIRELKALYENIGPGNFAHDILRSVTQRLALFELDKIHWSDWVHPERIAPDMEHIEAMPFQPQYENREPFAK